jgi:hypothetical protein
MIKDPIDEHIRSINDINEAVGNIKNMFNRFFNNKSQTNNNTNTNAPIQAGISSSTINNPFSAPNAIKNRTKFVLLQQNKLPKYTATTIELNGNFIWKCDSKIFSSLATINQDGSLKIIYDFNLDPLNISWLQNANFDCNNLYIQNKKIYFDGQWNNGNFGGVMIGDSEMNGGTIGGGIFQGKNSNFKINPKNIIYGGWMANDGIIGLEYATTQKNLDELLIFTVKKGQYIEFITNGGSNKYVLYVEKSPDITSMDMKLKNISTNKIIDINWQNDARNNLSKYTYKLGDQIDIPGLLKINLGIQSITVYDTYQATHNVGGRFIMKPFVINNIKPLNINATILIKPNQVQDYQEIISAINSGQFIDYSRELNNAIRIGEIDGYGKYNINNYLFDDPGNRSATLSTDNQKIMEFFEKFRRVVINNMINKTNQKPDLNLQRNYIARIRNFIGIKPSQKNSQQATNANNTSGKKPIFP